MLDDDTTSTSIPDTADSADMADTEDLVATPTETVDPFASPVDAAPAAPVGRTRRRRAAVREPGPPAPPIPTPADEADEADTPAAPKSAGGLEFQPPTFVAPTFVAAERSDLQEPTEQAESARPPGTTESDSDDDGDPSGTRRRRRGRRGRGRNRTDEDRTDEEGNDQDGEAANDRGADQRADRASNGSAGATDDAPPAQDSATRGDRTPEDEEGFGEEPTSAAGRRRRRRRRRVGNEGDEASGEAPEEKVPTVVHVRAPRQPAKRVRDEGEVQGVKGSTRLEAKRQRRRDSRDGGRKRPSIISESEFLARREAVDRVMVVREGRDRTQIGVLEDGVLVEHYVTRASATSYVGNVYLGRVQNVLPSMEAAFVDIGKGRNAVLYAGEVNYDASQFEGKPHRIEQALKSGDKVLVQVSKDPIGSKGSRLTSQISLPGRYVVYIPEGQRTGISRKLPDTERARLKSILKRVAPPDAGLIVRTAAEGASEEELARDMARLVAQWDVIQKKAAAATPPALLHAEPDLVIRVIRDVFNEDFTRMVVQGHEEWDTIQAYVEHVAPDLQERLERWTADGDVFAAYRVDEQLAKALDRKVWLPSGGYLVFDRTEAMVVVDVNTGKFTGKGGNLEETVTKNNLEAAEELVAQLRLRDLGGIIVVDFIDMVLEANRDLVLRRLLECLGRDRTKHQVAEVTSLGLVQMTRKRVGQGLQDTFAQICPECNGRGTKTIIDPFQPPEESVRTAAKLLPRPVPRPPTPAGATEQTPDENGTAGETETETETETDTESVLTGLS